MIPREGPEHWCHERALSNMMGLAPPPSMSGLLQGGEARGGGIGCNSTAVGCLWLAAQAAITFRKTHSRESRQSRNQGIFSWANLSLTLLGCLGQCVCNLPELSHLHTHCSQCLEWGLVLLHQLPVQRTWNQQFHLVPDYSTGGGKYLSPEGCCMQRLPAIPVLHIHTHSMVQEEFSCPQVSIGSSYV